VLGLLDDIQARLLIRTGCLQAAHSCCCVRQALQPTIFVSVPRLWNRIHDRVAAVRPMLTCHQGEP
jgi:long-subunit acyl-CoA synthetase (AMP-forming)